MLYGLVQDNSCPLISSHPRLRFALFLDSFLSPFCIFYCTNFSRCFSPKANDGSCSISHRVFSTFSDSCYMFFFALSKSAFVFASLALRRRTTLSLSSGPRWASPCPNTAPVVKRVALLYHTFNSSGESLFSIDVSAPIFFLLPSFLLALLFASVIILLVIKPL